MRAIRWWKRLSASGQVNWVVWVTQPWGKVSGVAVEEVVEEGRDVGEVVFGNDHPEDARDAGAVELESSHGLRGSFACVLFVAYRLPPRLGFGWREEITTKYTRTHERRKEDSAPDLRG